jgi:hypothetical protein
MDGEACTKMTEKRPVDSSKNTGKTEDWFLGVSEKPVIIKEKEPASCCLQALFGGLLGIDQEVVTLKWPLRRTPGLTH